MQRGPRCNEDQETFTIPPSTMNAESTNLVVISWEVFTSYVKFGCSMDGCMDLWRVGPFYRFYHTAMSAPSLIMFWDPNDQCVVNGFIEASASQSWLFKWFSTIWIEFGLQPKSSEQCPPSPHCRRGRGINNQHGLVSQNSRVPDHKWLLAFHPRPATGSSAVK